jgi:hypothetical protein
MRSLSDAILKRFFLGNNYYALGSKRTNSSGKEESIYNPVMDPPRDRQIEQHLMGEIILGAYTLRQDNTIMWMCFDVDSSDLGKAKDLTLKLSNLLQSIPHGIEYSGNKGYHIWVFFSKSVPAENVRALATEMRESIGGTIAGDPHIEIFPKQDKLTESNPLGNLVKIPLGIHPVTKNRSRFVFPDTGWEDGELVDPLTILEQTTTLEEFASCLAGYEDPIEVIVQTLSGYWLEGQRHDLALFLSGWLATAGWEEEDATIVVEKLHAAAGGDLNNQLQCVVDTYEKYNSGGQVLGLQALTDRLPGTIVRRLADAISKQKVTPIMTLIDRIRLNKGVTYLKSRSAANAVLSFLKEKGRIVIDTASDKLFWLDKTSHHLHSMEDSYWDSILYNTFGLNTADSFGVSTAKGVHHSARETANRIRAYNRSYWSGDKLYINLGTAYNYVLTGEENGQAVWENKHLNGEEDIVFRNRDSSLHIDLDQAKDKGITALNPWNFLVNDLSFGIGSTGVSPGQQRELIKAWFLSTFFPDIMPTRPLLTIIADPGAGKTTAARRFLYVLEGPHSNVNGVVADKPDSLRASMGAHKFIVLDNLEKNKSYWLVDLLNRISTGTHIELRKLHTTNEIQRILPDCFIILTATSLPFSEESLFTRLLPIELAAIKSPTPEYAMQNKILHNIDGIWMGIMGMLNKTVAELKTVKTAPAPTESRLADFTVFCNRIRNMSNGSEGVINGDLLIKGLEMMTNRQKMLLHESSPMIAVLDIWLREDREAGERTGRGSDGIEAGKWHTANELNGIFQQIAMKLHYQWIWESGQSLSKHIQALEPNLIRNYGMQIVSATNNSPKKYRFVLEMITYGESNDEQAEQDISKGRQKDGSISINLDRSSED